MLILYNSFFKKSHLINLCKINNIRNFSKLDKKCLLDIINKKKAVTYIQNYIRKKYDNDYICPITLEQLKYPFVCIKNNNNFRYYSLLEFIEYLNKSDNDFRDPFTRVLLSDNTMNQIENLIKYYKIKKSFNKKT